MFIYLITKCSLQRLACKFQECVLHHIQWYFRLVVCIQNLFVYNKSASKLSKSHNRESVAVVGVVEEKGMIGTSSVFLCLQMRIRKKLFISITNFQMGNSPAAETLLYLIACWSILVLDETMVLDLLQSSENNPRESFSLSNNVI